MQKNNLQDIFLTKVRKQSLPVTVFLMNGFQMRGSVTGFDSFTVVLDTDGRQQVIYKHAISTIAPAGRPSSVLPRAKPWARADSLRPCGIKSRGPRCRPAASGQQAAGDLQARYIYHRPAAPGGPV